MPVMVFNHYVRAVFNLSQSGSTSREFFSVMDSAAWTQNTMHYFDPQSQEEREQIYGAVQAYFSNAVRSAVNLPRVRRDEKLATVWAKIFLKESTAQAIRNAPITFKVLEIKDILGGVKIRIQLLPEYTDVEDLDNQVVFTLRKTASGYKVSEIVSNGIQFVALYSFQVKTLGKDVQRAINTLLNKKLIQSSQIEEYSQLK